MPQAYAGEQKLNAYIYFVPATVQQVQDFYNHELVKQGWQIVASAPSTLVPGSMGIMYQKDGKNLGIAAFPEGDATRVMIIPPP